MFKAFDNEYQTLEQMFHDRYKVTEARMIEKNPKLNINTKVAQRQINSKARNIVINHAGFEIAKNVLCKLDRADVVKQKIPDRNARRRFYMRLGRETFSASLKAINLGESNGVAFDTAYKFNLYFWKNFGKLPLNPGFDGTFDTFHKYISTWFLYRSKKRFRVKPSTMERAWMTYCKQYEDASSDADGVSDTEFDDAIKNLFD